MSSRKVVTLCEHKWMLPAMPKDRREIFFHEEKHAKNQYWRRVTDYPQFAIDWHPLVRMDADRTTYEDGMLSSLSREDTDTLLTFRDRELWRRQNGVWFFNNGEPTYLTGDHYFQLQWCQMRGYTNPATGDPYGDFRQFQCDYQYFIQFARESTDQHGFRNCAATMLVKPKKTGITQLVASNFLNRSTMSRQKYFGMMSKSDPDVKDANLAYYLFGFDNLPAIFQPEIANRTLSEIKFGVPRQRYTGSTASTMRRLTQGMGLETSMFTRPLKANAFDGPRMEEYWCDEWTKYEKPYPEEVYKKAFATVKVQEVIHGIGHWTSYTPETDGKSFQEGKKMWKDSKMNTMDKVTGRTRSEFFTYFISSIDSGERGFNIYGQPDREKNQFYIDSKKIQLKDSPSDLQSFIRQNPTTEEEAWREGGGGSTVYNNLRLGIRLQEVENKLTAGEIDMLEGWLEWKEPQAEGANFVANPVTFRPITEEEKKRGVSAPFRLYGFAKWMMIHAESGGLFNRCLKDEARDRKGRLTPGREGVAFVAACDPTEYAFKKGLKEASQQAITAMSVPDAAINSRFDGDPLTNRFALVYKFRYDDPEKGYDDIRKTAIFLGAPILLEANREWAATRMIKDGLQNFLLVRDPKTRAIEPYEDGKHQTLIKTVRAGNTDVIQDYIMSTLRYYAEPSGNQPDYLNMMDDDRILRDHMSFDKDDTKMFDVGVCASLNALAMESWLQHLLKVETRNDYEPTPEEMEAMFRKLLS